MDKDVLIELIASVTALATTVLSIVLGYALNKESKKKKSEVASYVPLTQHKCHSDIKEYIRLVRTADYNTTEGRSHLIKDMLISKYTAWADAMMEYAETVDNCQKNCRTDCAHCNVSYKHAMDMFDKGMRYEERAIVYDMSREDIETMKIFRDRFVVWHNPRVKKVKERIDEISYDNTMYDTCWRKGYRILELLSINLEATAEDAILAMRDLNGKLTNKKYKGHIC